MPKFSAYMRGEGTKGDTGEAAGFGNITASVTTSLPYGSTPQVSVEKSGENTELNLDFQFGLVEGEAAGFSTNQKSNIEFISVTSNPTVSITTDNTSPNNSKVFNFDFKIPEPLGISEITTVTTTTSEGINEITIWYNNGTTTSFNISNGAQGETGFIEGEVATTTELPTQGNHIGRGFLVGQEGAKHLFVYLNNEWTDQGLILGAGFGEPTSSAESIPTTSLSTASGSLVHLTDAAAMPVESLKVKVEPVQDLHGYDAPWPAGGGKNLLKPPSDGATINGVTYTLDKDADGNVICVTANGTASELSDFYFFGGSNPTVYENVGIPSGTYIITGNTAGNSVSTLFVVDDSGTIIAQIYGTHQSETITIDDTRRYRIFIRVQSGQKVTNQKYYPMIRPVSVSDATFAPYSNECPISGHASANIWDDPKYGGSITWKQLYPSGSTNWRQYSGTVSIADDGENGLSLTGETDAYSAAAYYYEGNLNIQNRVTYVTYKIRASVSGIVGINYGNYSYNDTIPTTWTQVDIMKNNVSWGSHYVGVKVSSGGTTGSVQIKDLMAFDLTNMFGETKANQIYAMEQQSAGAGIAYFRSLFPKDYYPYNITGDVTCISAVNGDPYRSITIDLDGERYGGMVDALTGVMTVTYETRIFNGTESWNVLPSDVFAYFYSGVPNTYVNSNSRLPILCDTFRSVSTSAYENGDVWFIYRQLHLKVGTDIAPSGLTAEGIQELRTWLSNHPITVTLPLASLTTVQLTPTELSFLLGTNNVWANTGDIEVTYAKMNEPSVEVTVDPESPESAKIFDFNFKIPQGEKGDKGDTPIIELSTSVTSLPQNTDPTLSLTTLGENNFRFDFGLPKGFVQEMTATATANDLEPGSDASATVTVNQNNLNFTFGIPQGIIGKNGIGVSTLEFEGQSITTGGNIYKMNFAEPDSDTIAFSTIFEAPPGPEGIGFYQKLEFTSTDSDIWINGENGTSTLIIDRTAKEIIPINIYNSTSNNIAATFTLANPTIQYPHGSIQYNTNEKFDGTLYYIGESPTPQVEIGSVTTVAGTTASVIASKNGHNTVLDFVFPTKGDKGDTGTSIASVTYDHEADNKTYYKMLFTDSTSTLFAVDKGDKGDTGTSISSITEGLSTSGNKMYTITFTDTLSPFIFEVEKGDQGNKGDKGDAGTIQIGNVSSSTGAGVYNTGTASTAILDFDLPKGDKGDQGIQGYGITNISAPVVDGLVKTYTITYGNNNNTTSFSVEDGLAATISFSSGVIINNSIEQPTVTVEGTSTNPLLTFNFPQTMVSSIIYTASTADFPEGGSLPTGTFYFQYEEE